MVNSLLSPTSVVLFGQKVTDIQIIAYDDAEKLVDADVSLDKNKSLTSTFNNVDGIDLNPDDTILLMNQTTPAENGKYILNASNKPISRSYDPTEFYRIQKGDLRGGKIFKGDDAVPSGFSETDPNFPLTKIGKNMHLLGQLDPTVNPGFARIYGFSYDGYYFELSRPTSFLVHGDGRPVSDAEFEGVPARAPRDPEQTGVGAADFQVASRMRAWIYDQADFTVRMDLDGGRFEDILLGFELDDGFDPDGGGAVGGGRVGGGRVGGGRVGGGRVGGGRVGGGRVGGGRVGGGRVGGGRVGGGRVGGG